NLERTPNGCVLGMRRKLRALNATIDVVAALRWRWRESVLCGPCLVRIGKVDKGSELTGVLWNEFGCQLAVDQADFRLPVKVILLGRKVVRREQFGHPLWTVRSRQQSGQGADFTLDDSGRPREGPRWQAGEG